MPPHIVDLNDWQVDEWPSTPEGEERQAKEIEEMYRILFAHPLVEAITTWDFTDGAWLHAPSGFIREDGTKKPSYEMLKNLVRNEWWTDTTAATDENGRVKVEAYKGEYKLSADGMTSTQSFTDNEELKITLR